MPAKCQQIINWIETIAPKKLAQDWDNVGLQLGSPTDNINKVMVSLDLNSKVAAEAVEKQVDMIITHHPYIFKPMKNLRTDLPQGKLLAALIKADVSVYSAHTNLDCAPKGVNTTLAQALRLEQLEVLKTTTSDMLFKIVVFVPVGHQEEVRSALASGGAGWIGNYSECGFELRGNGTFRPQNGANPFIGSQGELERVEEFRLETIVPASKLTRAVKAMIKAHPYEEVAYDIYPLENQGENFGLGLVGEIEEILFEDFVAQVKDALGIFNVKAMAAGIKSVKKVAVCGGSGADLIMTAKFKGADVLVTGDVSYHQAQQAEAIGIALIDAGHFATEKLIVPKLTEYIVEQAKNTGVELEVYASVASEDVWKYM